MITLRQRLTASLNRTLEKAKESDLQVGNSIQIAIDPIISKEFDISVLGRMQKSGDQYTVHAGPLHIDRSTWWTPIVDDHVDDVENLIRGKEVNLGRPRVDPRVEYDVSGTGVPNAYEVKLLAALSMRPLILVNPAKGTLFRVPKTDQPVKVCLTNKIGDRKAEIATILRGRGMKVEYVKEIDEMAYLGSNGVQDVCPQFWCALVPNPYQQPFPYTNFNIKVTDYGVVMEYDRAGRQVNTAIRYSPECYRYGPKQVDRAFFVPSKKTKGSCFFLESSVPIDMESADDTAEIVRYIPKYIPRADDLSYAEDDECVYDVPGTDTYLTRYLRIGKYARSKNKVAVSLYSTPDKMGISLTSMVPKAAFISFVVKTDDYTVHHMGNRYSQGMVDSPHYVRVYSPQFSSGNVSLPEGGEIQVPFDPETKEYQFVPLIPGKYFVMAYGCTSQDFFYSIMNELYGRKIQPYRIKPEMHMDYLDRQSRLVQVLLSQPETEKWDEGGLSGTSVAKKMGLSAKIIFPITRHVNGVYWYSAKRKKTGGIEMYYGHFDRLKEKLWNDKTYGMIMNDWYIDPRLVVPLSFVDRVAGFLRMQGLPVIKVKYKQEHAILGGVVDSHAKARYFR